MTHRILVVDDEPDITALVAYHLAKAGYRVSTAANGTEMRRKLDLLVRDPEARHEIAERALSTILARHTCRHRVDELLAALAGLRLAAADRRTA